MTQMTLATKAQDTLTPCTLTTTENGNDKLQDWTLQDWTMTDGFCPPETEQR